ncbi:MAG: xanthine dehydrogenase family protein molybdopterin-binding subunit [Pseudomonadota bacterium]|nr:xanthine dehydrogenase family protein molybdopterin-binding subunit [Pseudomonadota bacterium]
MNNKVFGSRVKRLEDPKLLRGLGLFIDDINLPNISNAAFVRSPFPHARLKSIDKTAAEAMPGVIAVYTYTDLKPFLTAERLPVEFPGGVPNVENAGPVVMVFDETMYFGECVAIVIAETRHIAEDASVLVDIDWEPLPAVGNCKKALEPGATLASVHTDTNLMMEMVQEYGKVDEIFKTAPNTFHEEIWQHRGSGHPIECRGAVGRYDPIQDVTTLWTSTQMPNLVQGFIIKLMGANENQVRVITPDVGGGFGPKFVFYSEELIIALSSKLCGRPVKWVEDRQEHFVSAVQERDQYWNAEIAVDDEGIILGIRGSLIHDHGAYTIQGITLPYNAATCVPGPYKVPNYRMIQKLVFTNMIPCAPVRGASHPQGTFVMERLLDRAARELKMDRAEIRLRNMIPGKEMPYKKPLKTRAGVNITYDSGDFPKAQQMAMKAAGYENFQNRQKLARQKGQYLGIGVSFGVKGTGRGPFETATVRIGTSGKISVYTGAAPMGQSTHTMIAQVVAEQLGGNMNNIEVVAGDTAQIQMGMGGFGSRQTITAGSSAHIAAIEVRKKALKVAANLLEASEEDLEIIDGKISVKGVPEISVTLGKIAHAVAGTPGYALPAGITPGMESTQNFLTDPLAYCYGSHICEIEADPETGGVSILKYTIVHDSGTLINPMIVTGQVQGGVTHGIGNAFFEWMGYDDDAQPVTNNFGEYLLPSAPETPNFDIEFLESPSPLNPLGVKGAGEGSTVPAAAAVISAIEDALTPFKVHITEAPVTPARLVELIKNKKTTFAA